MGAILGEPPITRRAAHISPGGNLPITRVVIHDEEYPVKDTSAEDIAAYFAGAGSGGSAHYVVDANSEQHCVPEADRAWHAPPNGHSIGIEMDGYSRFSREEWLRPGDRWSGLRAAMRTADLCLRHKIPIVKITAADLLAGRGGICGHVDVSQAWHESDHGDPGRSFPWPEFMQTVRDFAAGAPSTLVTPTQLTGLTQAQRRNKIQAGNPTRSV